MDQRPIIFLDVDGVLNNHTYNEEVESCQIDQDPVRHLNEILRRSKCKIVLCSAWRYMVLESAMTLTGMEYLLRTHGICALGRIIDHTRRDVHIGPGPHDFELRAIQVMAWLEAHPEVTNYVVLDDLDLGYTDFGVNFYQTNRDTGLTHEDVLGVLSKMRDVPMIKFWPKHIEEIISGRKTETWRPVPLSPAAASLVGEQHWACDGQGRCFAKIEVTQVMKQTITAWFAEKPYFDIAEKYGWESVDHMVKTLARYYPSETLSITPNTEVVWLKFKVVEICPEDYTSAYSLL